MVERRKQEPRGNAYHAFRMLKTDPNKGQRTRAWNVSGTPTALLLLPTSQRDALHNCFTIPKEIRMQSIFERCRGIPAKDAGEKAGLRLVRKGSRFWAHCPLHEDRTPSMLFNDNGTFKCFSCGNYGDSVRLLALIFHMEPLEAARRLLNDFGLAESSKGVSFRIPLKKEAVERELRNAVEDIAAKRINQLLEIKYEAFARMRLIEGDKSDAAELTEEDFDKLDAEIAKSSAAAALIDTIEAMTVQQQMDWVANGANFDEL